MRNMAAGLVSPVFAGREAELMLLAGAFEDAAGGTPRTVLIGAEAGGGKSRLVTEFTAMLPGERAQAHRAFAAALEARLEAGSRAGPESTLVVLAALHWRGAQDDERALAAAWRAAGAAGTALAYAQRLRMLEQVLELWDRVPESARPAGLDHVGVLEFAADAARWAGEPERGLALAEAAIAELDAVDDAERMALMLRRRAGLRQELLLP